MRRIGLILIPTVALCGGIYLLSSTSLAQTTSSCPSGFAEVGVEPADPLDINLDGLVCSSPNVAGNGIVEKLLVDNGAPPCGCPPAFFIFPSTAPGFDSGADRNENGITCAKIIPAQQVARFLIIDDRRGGPNCTI